MIPVFSIFAVAFVFVLGTGIALADAVSHRDFLRMIKDGRAVASLATELLALRKRVGELEEREVKNGRITAVWDEDMGQFRPLPTPKEPS